MSIEQTLPTGSIYIPTKANVGWKSRDFERPLPPGQYLLHPTQGAGRYENGKLVELIPYKEQP